jgi:hypothetical protein
MPARGGVLVGVPVDVLGSGLGRHDRRGGDARENGDQRDADPNPSFDSAFHDALPVATSASLAIHDAG